MIDEPQQISFLEIIWSFS